MIYTLKNDIITAKISDKGAEIVSVIREDNGCEYIWQGDKRFWTGQAPYLFPICGRLYGGKYTFDGKEYEMERHGFVRRAIFELLTQTEDSVSLCLTADDATHAVYPFDFKLTITHSLRGDTVVTDVNVENTGNKTLPAAFGAHPGFNVPLGDSGEFEDYYLEFCEKSYPDKLIFSDDGNNTGRKEALYLVDGRRFYLKHSLFDIDGVFMMGHPSELTLKSDKTDRSVTLRYPNLPYLGIWHAPKSDAPYVCIEPWYGLPSFCGEVDDFSKKSDMYRIEPNEAQKIHMEISFN